MENITQTVIEGAQILGKLPGVQAYSLIGSAAYLPAPEDVDYLVLLSGETELGVYSEFMKKSGWMLCGDYNLASNYWFACRKGDLNLIFTDDAEHFKLFTFAMELCVKLYLIKKEDRITVYEVMHKLHPRYAKNR
jgi:hypothetical protein